MNRALSVLGFLQRRQLRNEISNVHQHSSLKILVVTFFALVFWFFIFWFFLRSFDFLSRRATDFFTLIVEYLFSILYFTIFLMLSFSSAIIAFSSLFQAEETRYLFTCPLQVEDICAYKFIETLFFSSWAVLFLCLPVGLAYGLQQQAHWAFYPLLFMLLLPFITVAALIGTLLTFFIILYLPRRRLLWLLTLTGLGLLYGVLLHPFALHSFSRHEFLWLVNFLLLLYLLGRRMGLLLSLCILTWLSNLIYLGYTIVTFKVRIPNYSANRLLGLFDYLNFSRLPFLPSTWMTQGMFQAVQGQFAECLFYFLVLSANALFIFWMLYLLASRRYAFAWSKVCSASRRRTFFQLRWVKLLLAPLFFLKPQTKTLLEKDLKTFVRDPVQWTQFAILLGLLAFYILNLRTLNYHVQSVFWKQIVATMNLMATALTMCTFASRFIFPLLSLEGKRFWTLGVMPLKRRSILWGKFLFSMLLLLTISESLILCSCYMLKLPWLITLLHSGTILCVTLGVAGLSVGLGALYPNFYEDSPSKIVSGFGGTLNLILNLFFVFALVSLQTIPSHFLLREDVLGGYAALAIGLGLLITAIACAVPLLLGNGKFVRMEI